MRAGQKTKEVSRKGEMDLSMSMEGLNTREHWAQVQTGPIQEQAEPKKRELHEQFTDWLQDEFDYTSPRRNEVREGVILEASENDMIVDIGAKRDGIVLPTDLDRLDEEYRAGLKPGVRVPVVVLRTWGDPDGIVVSINLGLQRQDWLRAEELLESGEVFEAEVTDHNKGGLLVSFGRLNGFVPNSHLNAVPRGTRGDRLHEIKENLLGQTLSLVVIEVDQRRRRLVLSERKANHVRREQLLQELTEGEVRTGVVSNLVDFGAFVDLGGIDGLIHISELDWSHVDHPRDVLSVGEQVEVYVLDVDRERERIALSRKRLLPDPWYVITDELRVGQVVQGTVTSLTDFGAFVDVGKGIEGLVHISEMPTGRATLEALHVGDQVSVRVLEFDHDKRHIALSMRAVTSSTAQSVPSEVWEEFSEEPSEREAE
jgi:small subunit ribosomal protein S1